MVATRRSETIDPGSTEKLRKRLRAGRRAVAEGVIEEADRLRSLPDSEDVICSKCGALASEAIADHYPRGFVAGLQRQFRAGAVLHLRRSISLGVVFVGLPILAIYLYNQGILWRGNIRLIVFFAVSLPLVSSGLAFWFLHWLNGRLVKRSAGAILPSLTEIEARSFLTESIRRNHCKVSVSAIARDVPRYIRQGRRQSAKTGPTPAGSTG
jgi:hypothetical protein